ncbi:AurF N-oxygenase family protein [Nocardia pseudobrasiliensis]|uniref:Para-aminobenzoate N-oxygenase AurF n=1 Tax=Nocardia pseudobrasiliensis TaxID=45979 RepID=A0A370IEU4_9NOCA|nr:diiron oxygenase [Nocardia pseudobrasiliensis]RDI68641.1 para-aminobenzoate N-oxygenase AurF [Nocardia pseudobrasiliensis]
MTVPSLPEHDPRDPVESAVISRLVGNWHRRAMVKRPEPDLDELFEPTRPDYPEGLIPFRDHPAYRALDPDIRARMLGWGWVAFNKHIMDTEQHVVNPTFSLIIEGTFDTGLNMEMLSTAMTQAMVDEQYHTLMHLNASSVMRRRRGWRMPEQALPLGHKAARLRQRMAGSEESWQRDLGALAFTTVAEISINSYLDLIAADDEIQPINKITAAMHNRDEYCHSSIADEIAKAVYDRLGPAERALFREALVDGLEAFAANNFPVWHRIVDLVGIEGGHEMLREVEYDPSSKLLLSNFSGLHKFCSELDILEELPFDWSTVTVGEP